MIRDKTACARSLMIIFSAQLLFLCLGSIYVPRHVSSHVIYWPTPPSPSSDDVIYEQPLMMTLWSRSYDKE